jgi:hypothetical protein
LVLAIMGFSLTSLLKVTNEPLLSYNWVFYTDPERQAVEWLGKYGENAQVWTGVDERLVALAEASDLWKARRLKAKWGKPGDRTLYFVFSETMTLRAWRTGTDLPEVFSYNRIYDNDFAAVYRLRASSPYSR